MVVFVGGHSWGVDHDLSLLESPFDPEDELCSGKLSQKPSFRCPLELPKGWSFVADTNEMAGNHKGYPLPNCVVRNIQGPFDYTIEGPVGPMDAVLGVERKSLPNLLGEVTSGRDRWERALARMRDTKAPAIVLEVSLSRLLEGQFRRTRVSPESVIGSVLAWSRRYRVPVWLTESRSGGKMLTQWWLARAAWDIHREGPES